ncbi:hypothetical protein D3C78_1704430 [compost metagenome]
MFFRDKTVQPRTGLFVAAVGCQLARDRQLAGQIGMRPQHAEPFRLGSGAKLRTKRGMNRLRRQFQARSAGIVGPFGDEGRMFKHAAEAGDKFLTRHHQSASGL